MNEARADAFHVNRPLDLAAIDAVGFDLDHTLALYDDHALNLLATRETVEFLARRKGYPRGSLPAEPARLAAARGLSLDLRHGNILKIDARGAVRLARRGEHFLDAATIATRYAGHDPRDERATWHIHSPFDEPTLWFFSSMAHRLDTAPDEPALIATLLHDIRTMLDESHTRGELKRHVAGDLPRFVAPAGGIREGLEKWSASGKRLFVVTNSDRAFATAVLTHVLGPVWRELFAVVVTDAGKPRFFAGDAPGRDAGSRAGTRAVVLEGGSARDVERRIGVAGERILYAGDNARSDVIPARAHGWRTAHVVAELGESGRELPWGGALSHDGDPTWFAQVIRTHADLVCARVDALLDAGPDRCFAAGADLFARVGRGEAP